MLNVKCIYDLLINNQIKYFTGVPDSLLKDICAYITDNTTKKNNIITANEGIAVAMAVGHYLATGEIALVYMQNSGIGNAINPLLSLADEKVYKIPLLLMIGWRGETGKKDEPQHIKQGEVTLALLRSMQVPLIILEAAEDIAKKQIEKIIADIKITNKPHALIIRDGIFEKYKLQTYTKNEFPLSREEALQVILKSMKNEDIIISSTGKLSRELFEFREKMGKGHNNDFLTVGSMGHSSSIALGIALKQPTKRIWCLDGDGSFLMHMGAITNVGALAPTNFRHIVFNNGVHESVGGQPTVAYQIDMGSIIKGCGYKANWYAENQQQLESALNFLHNSIGPSFLEVKINGSSRKDLGRPSIAPIDNKIIFMNNLLSK